MIWTRYLVLFSLMATLMGCKMAYLKRDGKEAAVSNLVLPQPAGEAEAASGERYLRVDLNDDGRMRSALVLRLDFFSEKKSKDVRLPKCYKALPGDFTLGNVSCADKTEASAVELKVKNVEQECYTNPDVPKTQPSESIKLPGCKEAVVKILAFDPELRVDAEFR